MRRETFNKDDKKRIKNEIGELIIDINDNILVRENMSKQSVHTVMMSMVSRLNQKENVAIYSKPLNCIILARRERCLGNKSVVKVYEIINLKNNKNGFYLNTGLITSDHEEFEIIRKN